MNRQQRRAAERRGTGRGGSSRGTAEALSRAAAALRSGDRPAAERLYRGVIEAAPDLPGCQPAYANLGILLKDRAAYEEAEACFRKALELKPTCAATHSNLGNLLRTLGRAREALGSLTEAARIEPGMAEAHNNLGGTWRDLGRIDDAIASFRTAIRCDGRLVTAHIGLGTCLRLAGRVDEAVDSYRRALDIRPTDAGAHCALATALWDQGRLDEAVAAYRTALAHDPAMADAYSGMLFALCFSESVEPEALAAEHARFDTLFAAPLAGSVEPHANDRDPERKLRIGYVSPDFQMHPGGHFLMPHVMHHDRVACEVVCYAVRGVADHMTALFREHAEHWRPAEALGGARLARQIRDDRIDILVECSGHMAHNRLLTFALRPAPVQVSFPLYPATTGLRAIDYRISDRHFGPPTADALHSEALVRMPDAHVCYFPAAERVERAAGPPVATAGRVTFGCFNNIAKIGPSTVDAWARILRAVPGARLRVGWRGLDGSAQARVRDGFAARGVAPDRLSFLGWQPEPYSRYRDVDICLDPLFANGGTTTCDALWMGVPVVTCHGETPFSRVGLCHLTTAGLTELIADDVDGYVRLAVDLARDTEGLAVLRRGLDERVAATPLFDAPRYARHLDAAFREMWRRWCAGIPATPFAVAP